MGSDPGEQKTEQTTTYTPSPFDEQKGETLRMLRGLLFPAMTPQLAGGMTGTSQAGLESTNKQGISASASAGLGSGDENILSMLGSKKGDKTSALNMALGLYGYGGTGKPSSSTTGKSSPSTAQAAGAYGALGGSLYNAGKQAYDTYSKYANDYTNFDYGSAIPEDSMFSSQGDFSSMTDGGYTMADYGGGNLDYSALFGGMEGLSALEGIDLEAFLGAV